MASKVDRIVSFPEIPRLDVVLRQLRHYFGEYAKEKDENFVTFDTQLTPGGWLVVVTLQASIGPISSRRQISIYALNEQSVDVVTDLGASMFVHGLGDALAQHLAYFFGGTKETVV
jgi:hypothetical protein